MELADPVGREDRRDAVLDRHVRRHEAQRVNVDAVRTAIASAIEAGWDPASRGKAMVFDVDADGN